ncbi:hypothetical protein [Geobacter sp.]|uniref:hypothetical protein n=1 Tax=Geobacter sp. TaxID=46610 RepID=UPI001ACF573C|nr:hypothetical protein [Geobacter sp.]CAG0990102.1 hypothetical protein ANAEL_02246 [Anaerolineales bacterium]
MKRLVALAAGVFLSIFLVAAVNAAPAGTSDKPKQQQGIKNAKKAMQSKLERDKKMREVQKKGQAKRQQIQSAK